MGGEIFKSVGGAGKEKRSISSLSNSPQTLPGGEIPLVLAEGEVEGGRGRARALEFLRWGMGKGREGVKPRGILWKRDDEEEEVEDR